MTQASTSTGILLFQVVGAIAEFERSLIRERVMLGLQRAKAQGIKLGRPRVSIDLDKLRELHGAGLSHRKIAAVMDISQATIGRALLNDSKTP